MVMELAHIPLHLKALSIIWNGVTKRSNSDYAKEEIANYMNDIECPSCHGERLKPEALAVTVGGRNISEITKDEHNRIVGFYPAIRVIRA